MYLKEPLFFWLNLPEKTIVEISVYQIIGFFLLLITLPNSKYLNQKSNFTVSVPSIYINVFLWLLFFITLPGFIEMILLAPKYSGRIELFKLSVLISEKYFLKYVFVLLSTLVTYKVYLSRNLINVLFLLPIVLIEVLAMGRVWPFAFITILLIGYLYVKGKMVPKKYVIYSISIFAFYSMLRLIGGEGELSFLDSFVFLFGESFNTQVSIEIALFSNTNLPEYTGLINFFAEFLPFGIKYLFIIPNSNVVDIIDNSKEFLYGYTEVGFGSSWVSQYFLYYGYNVYLIFFPILISISIHIYKHIDSHSKLLGFFYLYFFISGLFMFFRYGLNLSISYPLINVFYVFLLFLLLKFIFYGTFNEKNKNKELEL
jgi:hypothetical protein